MTREEKIICKSFLHDADNTHSCNEYKLLMELLEQEPTTKNDLGVDCISREQAIDAFPDLLPNIGYNKKAITEILQELPSVTPQEPCDKCEVGNPCLYCKHEFEPQESKVEE